MTIKHDDFVSSVIDEIRPGYDAPLNSLSREQLQEQLNRAIEERSAAIHEARVQNKACAEEMLNRQAMEKNWNVMVNSIKQHYNAYMAAVVCIKELRAELASIAQQQRADDVNILREWAAKHKRVAKNKLKDDLPGSAELHEMEARIAFRIADMLAVKKLVNE